VGRGPRGYICSQLLIIGHNWPKRLRGPLCSALSPVRTVFCFFRTFPAFSGLFWSQGRFRGNVFRKFPRPDRRSLSRRDIREKPSVSTLGFAVKTPQVPKGRPKAGLKGTRPAVDGFSRPFGTDGTQNWPVPALKRWAIVVVSLRDKNPLEFPKGIGFRGRA